MFSYVLSGETWPCEKVSIFMALMNVDVTGLNSTRGEISLDWIVDLLMMTTFRICLDV